MLKHKKILSLLLVLPLFSVFSCAKAKESYQVRKFSSEPDVVKEHLEVTGELEKKEYDTTKEEELNLTGLVITINGEKKDLVEHRRGDKTSILEEGTFFVCEREDLPTNTIVHIGAKAGTNVEKMNFSFYIGTAIKVNDSYEIYVSQSFTVTIKNPNAIKPWVWYVVTGVVIFGVIGMVMLTRHYKNKKEGKN